MDDANELMSANEISKTYKPEGHELAIVEAFFADREAKAARPRMKVKAEGKKVRVAPDHPDHTVAHILLAKALGTSDEAFAQNMLLQLAYASGKGPMPDQETLNFLLSVVEGIAPRDQTEAMLAAQMATVHCAIMTFARRLNHVDNIAQQDAAERAFNKLARTFAVQMEALKRYRTGGEQQVTVQHVHVNEGGQAIVGTVAQMPAAGRGTKIPEAAP